MGETTEKEKEEEKAKEVEVEEEAEETEDEYSGKIGRKTMTIVLDSIDKAHARAQETSMVVSKRVFMVIMAVLLLLAAVLGITTNVKLPGGTEIAMDPEEIPIPEVLEPEEVKDSQ